MIVGEAIESLCVVSQRLYHVVSDIQFSLDVKESLDVVVDLLQLSPLNKEGKELLIKALNEYLEEDSIRYKNRNQTRANIIQQEAHSYANQLIEKTKDTSETLYL